MKKDQINPSDELKKLRKIIGNILELLESNISKNENQITTKKRNKQLKSLIGEKESVISTIYKLGNLLLKIDSISKEENDNELDKLDQLDIEIIGDFFNKKNY